MWEYNRYRNRASMCVCLYCACVNKDLGEHSQRFRLLLRHLEPDHVEKLARLRPKHGQHRTRHTFGVRLKLKELGWLDIHTLPLTALQLVGTVVECTSRVQCIVEPACACIPHSGEMFAVREQLPATIVIGRVLLNTLFRCGHRLVWPQVQVSQHDGCHAARVSRGEAHCHVAAHEGASDSEALDAEVVRDGENRVC